MIDTTISKEDERWDDTVEMLTTFIEYSLTEDPQVAVVLLGGSPDPQVPITFADDASKQDVIDYINNDMPSLGGERYTLNSLNAATSMLQALDSDPQMMFFVTHGPTLDASQSPCALSAIWYIENIRLITLMDGDVGNEEYINCLERAPYEFQNVTLYFNTTSEYQFNMDKIQGTTSLDAEVTIASYLVS